MLIWVFKVSVEERLVCPKVHLSHWLSIYRSGRETLKTGQTFKTLMDISHNSVALC